tara:strand:- start:2674 stop:3036 length:363 start_codon:yes stop_codon:yes gene_type:complete
MKKYIKKNLLIIYSGYKKFKLILIIIIIKKEKLIYNCIKMKIRKSSTRKFIVTLVSFQRETTVETTLETTEEATDNTTDAQKYLAIINYEKHYKMEPGTATIGDVKRSSAGIQGWYEDTN